MKHGPDWPDAGICAVSIAVQLRFPIIANVPHAQQSAQNETIATYVFPVGDGILTGPRSDMQERLEKRVYDYGDELFLMISRARDDIFRRYPAIKASFEAEQLQ